MLFEERYRYISSVGVELEGGIDERCVRRLRNRYGNRFNYGYDGSVYVRCNGPNCNSWDSSAELRFWSRDYDELASFVRDAFYSCRLSQNDTCGNHVHVRFRNHNHIASIVASEEFIRKFASEYRRFAREKGDKYIQRMTSGYCRLPSSRGDIEAIVLLRDRYRAVNLVSLVEPQKTVEFRILPYASSYNEYMDNLNWLLSTVDRIIHEVRKPIQKRYRINITIAAEPIEVSGDI